MEKKDLSYYWSCLFLKQIPENFDGYNSYMIEQWLVKYQSYQNILIEIGKYNLDKKQHFLFLQRMLPRGLPRFYKETIEKNEIDKMIIQIQRIDKCSKRDAEDYMKFYNINELSDINSFFEEYEVIKK